MRLLLLAFALGVLALQRQAALPRLDHALFVALTLGAALAVALAARCASGQWRRVGRNLALLVTAIGVGMAGFFYAAWRAEMRLADELPSVWEGRDIELVGIVDDLPQPADRGMRFALSVEGVVTAGAIVPSRLSLAWYTGWQRNGSGDAVPELHAGERWHLTVRLKRPHGTVNPNGFDVEAWLLENNLRATGNVRQDKADHRVDAFAGRA